MADDYLDRELASVHIPSIEVLDQKLTEMSVSLQSHKEILYAELKSVQSEARSSLQTTSIESLRDYLHVPLTQTFHISLDTSHRKVHDPSDIFASVCSRLTQLHKAKENAANLMQSLMQLQQLNSNDSDIDLDAERIILIRSALEELNSPVYTTVGDM